MPNAIFFGAHPDDIEIGAGGTLRKLNRLGWETYVCVLTDDIDSEAAKERRRESARGLQNLGVKSDNVLFFGWPDGYLQATRDEVGAIRGVIRQRQIEPDLIFTHSTADSHNDHRSASSLVHATFRKKIILGYPIINSLNETQFRPRIFSDITYDAEQKALAILAHGSQAAYGRVDAEKIKNFDTATGASVGVPFAEGFEITIQYGASLHNAYITSINDCSFSQLWFALLRHEPLVHVHGRMEGCASAASYRASLELVSAFSRRWVGKVPAEHRFEPVDSCRVLLEQRNFIFFCTTDETAFATDLSRELSELRFLDTWWTSEQEPKWLRNNLPICDPPDKGHGSVAFLRNPVHPLGHLILAVGESDAALIAAARCLYDPALIKKYAPMLSFPIPSNIAGYRLEFELLDQSIWIDPEVVSFEQSTSDTSRDSRRYTQTCNADKEPM